jgi:hypothetical protein
LFHSEAAINIKPNILCQKNEAWILLGHSSYGMACRFHTGSMAFETLLKLKICSLKARSFEGLTSMDGEKG